MPSDSADSWQHPYSYSSILLVDKLGGRPHRFLYRSASGANRFYLSQVAAFLRMTSTISVRPRAARVPSGFRTLTSRSTGPSRRPMAGTIPTRPPLRKTRSSRGYWRSTWNEPASNLLSALPSGRSDGPAFGRAVSRRAGCLRHGPTGRVGSDLRFVRPLSRAHWRTVRRR